MHNAMTAIPKTAAMENAPNGCVPEKAPLLTPRIGPPDVTCKFAKTVLSHNAVISYMPYTYIAG